MGTIFKIWIQPFFSKIMTKISWMWKNNLKKIIFDGLHPKKLKIVNLSKIYKIDVDSENLLTTNIAIPQRIVVISLHMNLTMMKMICSWIFFIILGVSGVLLECELVKNELEIVKNYPQNAKNEPLYYLTVLTHPH